MRVDEGPVVEILRLAVVAAGVRIGGLERPGFAGRQSGLIVGIDPPAVLRAVGIQFSGRVASRRLVANLDHGAGRAEPDVIVESAIGCRPGQRGCHRHARRLVGRRGIRRLGGSRWSSRLAVAGNVDVLDSPRLGDRGRTVRARERRRRIAEARLVARGDVEGLGIHQRSAGALIVAGADVHGVEAERAVAPIGVEGQGHVILGRDRQGVRIVEVDVVRIVVGLQQQHVPVRIARPPHQHALVEEHPDSVLNVGEPEHAQHVGSGGMGARAACEFECHRKIVGPVVGPKVLAQRRVHIGRHGRDDDIVVADRQIAGGVRLGPGAKILDCTEQERTAKQNDRQNTSEKAFLIAHVSISLREHPQSFLNNLSIFS